MCEMSRYLGIGDAVMRWAAQVDFSQKEIVYVLRRAGCSVQLLSSYGRGVPDLLVGIARGRDKVNLLLEVKDSNQPPSKQRLTPAEEEWHRKWRGQVAIVKSAQEAIDLVNQYRRES